MTKKTLIFLHGWAKKKEDYSELLKELSPTVKTYALDLPGFGEEPIFQEMKLADYAQFVANFIENKKIGPVILCGHSFGGRVSIKLASEFPDLVQKLILIDSSGIERKSLKTKIIKYLAAFTPERVKELLRPLVGSKDYLASIGLVRETMKNIVGENLEEALTGIKIPTLLIWGDKDHTTPLWQGKLMNKLIDGSQLVIIPDGDHGVPYRRVGEVAAAVKKFL